MPTDESIYREKMSEVIDVPAPDNLVQGNALVSEIKIAAAGSYKRGEVLVSTGNNEFTSADVTSFASAKEVCILTRDCEVAEGNVIFTAGYFTGTFSGDSIVMSYETEDDDHAELIAALKVSLRHYAIYII